MSRYKNKYDEDEVCEIIKLKLEQLGGVKSNLTYNNVWNFNKKLVEEKVKRLNGEYFNLYGYTFWASSYKGKDYYGKQKIDEIKKEVFVLAGKSFETELQDIFQLVKDYHKNPRKTSEIIIKNFLKDKKKIEFLEERNRRLEENNLKLKEDLNQFKNGFATIFFNSIESTNSLSDVMSLKKSEDIFIYDELKNMFNDDLSFIENNTFNENTNKNNKDLKVLNIQHRIKQLEDEGF